MVILVLHFESLLIEFEILSNTNQIKTYCNLKILIFRKVFVTFILIWSFVLKFENVCRKKKILKKIIF